MDLHPGSTVVRNGTRHLSNPMGEDVILLNLDTGDYVGLNRVGAAIWHHLEQPIRIDELVRRLMDAFEVEEATCLRETLGYLENIHALGLLRTAPNA